MLRANELKKNIFFFVFVFQIIILFLIIFILYIKKNMFIASVLYGGLTSSFSSASLLLFLSKKTSIKKIIKNFYLSIFLKTMFLFLLFLFLINIGISSPIYFFTSFLIIQASFWFGCFFYFFLYGDINFYEHK